MEFVNPDLRTANGARVEAYVPPAVRLGHIPRWLTRRIRRVFSEITREQSYYRYGSDELLVGAVRHCYPSDVTFRNWLDHWGFNKGLGSDDLCFRPFPSGLPTPCRWRSRPSCSGVVIFTGLCW